MQSFLTTNLSFLMIMSYFFICTRGRIEKAAFNYSSFLISSQFLGVNLMWFIIHAIIWDGKVSNVQDITASLLSPGT